MKGELMTFTIIDGPAEGTFKPAPYYAEVAMACRAVGMDIRDDDYDRIEALLEMNARRATTVQSLDWFDPAAALVAGYLPYEANETPLLN